LIHCYPGWHRNSMGHIFIGFWWRWHQLIWPALMHHFHWKFRGFDGNQWICQVFLLESNDYTDLRNSFENIRIPMSAGTDV
jgi:hypothetical protein